MGGSSDTLLHKFQKNARETVCISLSKFKGKSFVSIRCWYRDGEDNLKPGRNGLTLPPDELKAVAGALMRAKALLDSETP